MTFFLRSLGFITLPGLLVPALLIGPAAQAAPITYDFSINDGGFTAGGTTGAGQPWSWNSTLGQWEVPQSLGGGPGTSTLAAPLLSADGSPLTLAFSHERDFDGSISAQLEDFGRLWVSINEGANQRVGIDIGSFSQNGYNVTFSGAGFGGGFGMQTSIAEITGLSAGDSLAFQWIANWDCCGIDGDPAWNITSVEIDGVQMDEVSVPVPSSALLLGLGLGAFGFGRLRRASA